MLNTILLVFFLLVVALSFFKINRAVELTVLYRLVVPSNVFLQLGGLNINLTYWLVYILIFAFLSLRIIKKYEGKRFDLIIFKPLILFLLLTFGTAFLATEIPIGVQLKAILTDALFNFSMAFIVWHTYTSKKELTYLIRMVVVGVVIMTTYGIYCFVTNTNMYILVCNLLYPPALDALTMYQDQTRGGLMGRVQSTNSHPMEFAANLVILFFLILILVNRTRRSGYFFYVSLLVLVFINMVASGTRSALFAVFAGMLFLIKNISLKAKLSLACFALLILLLGLDTSIFGKYQSYADSFNVFSSKGSTDINGSSLEQRTSQFQGAYNLINDKSFFFGKGYYWCRDYLDKYGNHPDLLAFESTLFVVLIENGIFGLFIWIVLFSGIFMYKKKTTGKFRLEYNIKFKIVNALIIAYITYIIITGISGTFSLFFMSYIIMVKYIIFNDKEEIEQAEILSDE
jgi:hypothetical protein